MARSVRPLRFAVALVVVALVALGLSGCVADPPPIIGAATPGDAQAVVSWQPPLAAPAAITTYVVTPWIGFTRQTPVVFNSAATTDTVNGLTNGVTYTFTVHALNAQGNDSAESGMSNPVTPAPAPLALYGWGGGATTNPSSPARVGTDTWASVSEGNDHTVAIKTDGTLWTWGSNAYGQLGIGTVDSDAHSSPVQVGTDSNWSAVAGGYAWTAAVKSDGTLWTWGNNWAGQLGDGTTTDHASPAQVGTATDWATVAAGYAATMAINTDGTLWAWGDNEYGQLGIATIDNDAHPNPVQIAGTNWATVAAGTDHTVAVTTDGTLWTWGYNAYGQLGDGTADDHYGPAQVGTATNWATVTAGFDDSTLAVTTGGTLWAWGSNDRGQLGIGGNEFFPKFSPVQVGTTADWNSVSAGNFYTVAVKTDGTLWAWGDNNYGELGIGTVDNVAHTSPVRVGSATDWASVAAGGFHTMAITAP